MVLNALQNVLKEAPFAGLQRCMDYALFSLLLLLDAAVVGRASNSGRKTEGSAKDQVVRIGDKVAEGVLSCLEVILRKCFVETTSQATMLLQKMISAAMLSPTEAAEEFRHGVVKCLQALLQNLRPCDNVTCVCKLTSSSPFVVLNQNPLTFFSECAIESKELSEVVNTCPLGYLRSENMSATVGHLLSLLLQIGEGEAARGAVGSGKLRRDALSTVRTLILRVGTADGVDFFLPGVVSGFTKVLLSSRASKGSFSSSIRTAVVHTSWAAGWPAAVEEAIKGLTVMLVIVLGDEKNSGWLSLGSGSKLYSALVYVLRLPGLSTVTDERNGTSLVSLIKLLLGNVRQAAATISSRGYEMTAEERISSGPGAAHGCNISLCAKRDYLWSFRSIECEAFP